MKTQIRTITRTHLSICTAALCLALGWGHAAEPATATNAEPVPSGGLTFGAGGNDEEAVGYLDFLMRITGREHDLLYLAPRISVSDASEEEFSIGLGYRYLLQDPGLIFGGNVYYDSRWTANNNRFDQFGAGLEMLSSWVDARLNYYWPEDDRHLVDETSTSETTLQQNTKGWGDVYAQGNGIYQAYTYEEIETTTSRLYRRYEEALEGYDAEIGVKVPFLEAWAEARLFVGYQDFDGPKGQDLDGPKGRAEVYALPGVILDAEVFDNKDLNRSDFYVGARVRLPFDISRLAHGENPFAGSSHAFKSRGERTLAQRLDEMVHRDPKIRTTEGSWEEVEEAKSTATTRHASAETLTLLDDITFVDGDNDTGIEDGTAENPYDTVSEGVDNANSPVYVAEAAADYVDNVTLPEDVDLYGAGIVLQGGGGRTYGGGTRPVLTARTADPTITIAGNNVTVAGLSILNTHTPLPAMPSSGAGIYANGVTGIEIRDNIVSASGDGVLLVSGSAQAFAARVVDNLIHNCGVSGLRLDGNAAGGRFEFEASGDFLDNGDDGLSITAISNSAGRTTASLYLHDLTASGNGQDGLGVKVTAAGSLDLRLQDVTASGNAFDGIEDIHLVTLDDNAPLTATFANIATEGNGSDGVGGIDAQTWGNDSPAILRLERLTAIQNAGDGVESISAYTLGERSGASISLAHISANSNTNDGVSLLSADTRGANSPSGLVIADATFNGNLGSGITDIEVDTRGTNAPATIMLSSVTASGNGDSGIKDSYAQGHANYSDTTVVLVDVAVNNNANRGITGVNSRTWGDEGAALLALSNVDITNNGGVGVYKIVVSASDTDADATLNLSAVTASGNNGHGIRRILSSAADGDATINMDHVAASGNRDWGISNLTAEAFNTNTTSFSVAISDSQFNHNGEGGLTLNSVGNGLFQVASSTVVSNQEAGIRIAAPVGATAPITYNFGDDAAGTGGNNSLYGNVGGEITLDVAGTPVKAENNWWGADQDPVANGQVPASVDADPRLTADPN